MKNFYNKAHIKARKAEDTPSIYSKRRWYNLLMERDNITPVQFAFRQHLTAEH